MSKITGYIQTVYAHPKVPMLSVKDLTADTTDQAVANEQYKVFPFTGLWQFFLSVRKLWKTDCQKAYIFFTRPGVEWKPVPDLLLVDDNPLTEEERVNLIHQFKQYGMSNREAKKFILKTNARYGNITQAGTGDSEPVQETEESQHL